MSDLQLSVLNTGAFSLDGGAMLGRVPKSLWEKQMPADSRNRIKMTMRCLLARWRDNDGKPRALLVDTGAGEKWNDKQKDIYAFQPNPNAWREANATPEEITDVLLTHLHFDHCGGSTKWECGQMGKWEDGLPSVATSPTPDIPSTQHPTTPMPRIVPAFPNAQYYIGKEHRAYVKQPSLLDRASFMPENYEPLEKLGRVKLIEPPTSPWPHIRLLQFFGHTRGIVLPLINVGDKIVFFAGDLMPTRLHVRLAWIMGYDLSADETLGEKSFVLELAAENKWGIFLEHDYDTELVTVRREKEDFAIEKAWKLEEFLGA
jgi:glyoxylase-like metal-dependent hydrolase (beta-lactamase superfamily II)